MSPVVPTVTGSNNNTPELGLDRPALVLGIFWSRANHWGALAGMTSGLAITLFYLSVHHPGLRSWWGIHTPWELWWGIQPIAAGVFAGATMPYQLVAS